MKYEDGWREGQIDPPLPQEKTTLRNTLTISKRKISFSIGTFFRDKYLHIGKLQLTQNQTARNDTKKTNIKNTNLITNAKMGKFPDYFGKKSSKNKYMWTLVYILL